MTDQNIKKEAVARLDEIVKMIQNLEAMLAEERYCLDILNELSEINTSLSKFGSILVEQYIKNDFIEGLRNTDREAHYEELMRIIFKLT